MNDFRYAWRGLRRSPAVASVGVLSLALGIGATTAIFSVSNAVMLRSLPVQNPADLVVLRYVSQKGNIFESFDYDSYGALRDAPGVLAGLAAVYPIEVNLASDEASERVAGNIVSGNYFGVVGVRAQAGRLIGPEDDRSAGGHPVCVLSASLWRRRFGSAADIVGRQIRINGRPYAIVGVAADGFEGVQQGKSVQVYLPLMMAAEVSSRPADEKVQPPFRKWDDWLDLIGRLRPGVDRSRAEAVLDARFAPLPLAHRATTFEMSSRHGTSGARGRLLVESGRQGFDNLRFGYERPLRILLFLVGLLLAIACANVANLLLARAAGRRREIAVRIALGGGAWDLMRQMMAESILLAAGGAAGGLLLAAWMAELLARFATTGSAAPVDARPDVRVLGFLLGVTCLTTMVFGLAPVWATLRSRVAPDLKNRGGGSGKAGRRLGELLVVAQVTLSVTLLAGAGLLLRSLHNLQSIEPGFRADHVLLASLNPAANHYSNAQARTLYADLLARAESIHGVRSASAALVSPLSGNLWLYSVDVPGYQAGPRETPMVYFNAIGPGYFATLGSRLVGGREFTGLDRAGAPPTAVVNEEMARKFWPGRDAVGQRFKMAGRSMEVVGVVRDSIYRDLREPKQVVVYVPLLQGEYPSATLELRVSGDAAPVFADLRAAARQVDRSLPLFDMRTLEAQIADTLSAERMLAAVSTLFGALAMLLASAGLYGVLAYAVAQRTREIGIRMALGAGQNQVVGAVLRDGLRTVAAGLALGIPLALAASRWIASSLYGLRASDPLTYVSIVGVLGAAALAAALVPSRRAARVDPMVVLRCD